MSDSESNPRAQITDDLYLEARNGNEEAWNLLFARLRPWLKKMLHGRMPRALRGVAETSDLVQDTLLSLCKALRSTSLQGEAAVRRFAARVALNRATDALRHGKVQPQRASIPTEEGEDAFTDDAVQKSLPVGPDREALAIVLSTALDISHDKLYSNALELWIRRRIHDESLPDLGKAFGITQATARMRIYRFEKALKGRFSGRKSGAE